MNQISPYPLWVGHAGDGRDFQMIFDKGIRAVVQLALEEPSLKPPRELIYLHFPLLDGGGNTPALVHLAVTNVSELIRQRIPTLVCCGAGMSRSPAIVAAALSLVESIDVGKCLERVTKIHPVDISTTLWKEVREVIKEQDTL